MRLALASTTLVALTFANPASAQEIGSPFCFGDGSGSACPCNFVSAPGHGCPNGLSATGARLFATGTASVSADSVEFTLDVGAPTSFQIGFLFQGTQQLNGGSGVAFGDGLRCAGGAVSRIGVAVGQQTTLFPTIAAPPVSVLGGVPLAGGTFHYQAWYRDITFHCAAPFNMSNGVSLTWAP